MKKINVTVWNEFRHDKTNHDVQKLYPNGIHMTIKELLEEDTQIEVITATLDEPECGLTDEVLENTDVLIWWGHIHHNAVPDELVNKIRTRVYRNGMGFIALHSAHHSKPFKTIIGATGNLSYGIPQREVVWNIMPAHPIAKDLPTYFTLESEELYSEPFYIPQPDELIFNSWFEKGYVFRSGACWYRGVGKVFYFQPGHETCCSFYNPYVRQIITNAVHWAAPNGLENGVPEDCICLGDDCAADTPAVYK